MSFLLSLLVLAPINSAFAQDEPEEEAVEEEAEAPKPTLFNYTLNAGASTLWVRTTKTGIGAALAHNHAIHATGWTGTATWDTADASKCSIQISAPVSGLVVDDPGVRKAIGLEEGPDADDRKTITGHMLASNQLDAGKFGTITYKSSSCSGTSGAVTVKGTLTVHGVGAPIAATLNVSASDAKFSASGNFNANHGDFGITPYSTGFGAIANAEPLQFGLNITGTAN